ncbi:permease prefix domain 1-containing protein [Clostridium sp. BJN0013]|uniref:permease prefix domain 1-containing protein n=1 Tax=Clostridium sp. BJN0013 TaxID=3236840 RepID=UPI0034C69C51
MLKFEQFIEDIIDKRGINENDKLELRDEIESHLLLLENEYLEKGYDKKTAINLAIDSFGDSNLIGNDLKLNLPSKNKYYKFNIKNMIKLICNMILISLISTFFFICILNKNTNSNYFLLGVPLINTIFSYLYINIKISNTKNAIKNIIICNILLYIILKLLATFVMFIGILLFGSPFHKPLSLALFGFLITYISNLFIPFILCTVVSVIFTKLFNKIIFSNIRNIYENKLTSVLLFSLSILLWIGYYMLPSSNLILKKILTNLINSNIIQVKKIYYI